MNGGNVYFAPDSYYGLSGLGQAAGSIAGYLRERDERKRLELLQNLEVARRTWGEQSTQYQTAANQVSEMLGFASGTPQVSVETLDSNFLRGLYEDLSSGDPARQQAAEAAIQTRMTGDPRGGQGLLRDAEIGTEQGELGLDVTRQNLQIGERQIDSLDQNIRQTEEQMRISEEYRNVLNAMGLTPGGLQAQSDALGVEGQRLNNQATSLGMATERLRQSQLHLQNEALRTELAKAEEEGLLTDDGSKEIYQSIWRGMIEQGMHVPSMSWLVRGTRGELPAEDQENFNAVYSQYLQHNRAVRQAEFAKLAVDSPDPNVKAAAEALTMLETLREQGYSIDVSPSVHAELISTAIPGLDATAEERFILSDQLIFNWTPPTPGVPSAAAAGGQAISPDVVQSTLDDMLEGSTPQNVGAMIRAQQDALNEETPGLGDALLSQFRVQFPEVPVDSQSVSITPPTTPNAAPASPRTLDIPPAPAMPPAGMMSASERTFAERYLSQRPTLSLRAVREFANGNERAANRLLDEIRRGDERIQRHNARTQETHDEIKKLSDELEQIDNLIENRGGAVDLNQRRARILSELERLQSQLSNGNS